MGKNRRSRLIRECSQQCTPYWILTIPWWVGRIQNDLQYVVEVQIGTPGVNLKLVHSPHSPFLHATDALSLRTSTQVHLTFGSGPPNSGLPPPVTRSTTPRRVRPLRPFPAPHGISLMEMARVLQVRLPKQQESWY